MGKLHFHAVNMQMTECGWTHSWASVTVTSASCPIVLPCNICPEVSGCRVGIPIDSIQILKHFILQFILLQQECQSQSNVCVIFFLHNLTGSTTRMKTKVAGKKILLCSILEVADTSVVIVSVFEDGLIGYS